MNYTQRPIRQYNDYHSQNTLEGQGVFINPTIRTMPNSISPPRQYNNIEFLNKDMFNAQINEQERLKSRQEKIEILLSEIEKLNGVLRKQTSNLHELSAKLSQTELFYQQRLQEQEIQFNYEVELQKSINREKQVEISKQNQIIKQQQNEIDDLYKQIQNFNRETEKVKETMKSSNKDFYKLDNQSLKVQVLKLQEELNEQNNQAQKRIQEQNQRSQIEIQQQNGKINQFSYQLQQTESQLKDQNILIEHQQTQITQLRKTISLLEESLEQDNCQTTQYQQLLQNYNKLKESLEYKQQLEEQLHKSNNLVQQQSVQIDKLKLMLRNRLDEIEVWKNKSYSFEQSDQLSQLLKENEILRQKCNILEINIKENSQPDDQELKQLLDVIQKQKKQIESSSGKRVQTQFSSPKRYQPQEYKMVREFNRKQN